jgi:hypothetical protein
MFIWAEAFSQVTESFLAMWSNSDASISQPHNKKTKPNKNKNSINTFVLVTAVWLNCFSSLATILFYFSC